MSEHPADAFVRLCKDAGLEADPEAVAEIRAVCDAPAIGGDSIADYASHNAILEWQEREISKLILGVGAKPPGPAKP